MAVGGGLYRKKSADFAEGGVRLFLGARFPPNGKVSQYRTITMVFSERFG